MNAKEPVGKITFWALEMAKIIRIRGLVKIRKKGINESAGWTAKKEEKPRGRFVVGS